MTRSLPWLAQIPSTPAFVLDETCLQKHIDKLLELREQSGCKILYSVKALPLQSVIALAGSRLDGVSVSSLFEAKLARDVLGEDTNVQLATPGLRTDEFEEISALCSHISFNSVSQWQRLAATAKGYSPGIRINPKMSFLNDARYDPCRRYSKLGVDPEQLLNVDWQQTVEGLHLHTVFSCQDYSPLLQTVERMVNRLTLQGQSLHWLNLGGGYLFSQIEDSAPFKQLVGQLRHHFGCEVFIEPGNDVVGKSGFLVASVLDQFDSDGKSVTILDSSVNHLPEVFEYQRSAALHSEQHGKVPVILAGSTCLAGDIFGEYQLAAVPAVGQKMVFASVGAYSLIKANRFNGYNFPDVYGWNGEKLLRIKHYDYQDYRRQWLTD